MNTSFELFPPHASAMSWSVDWLLLYMTTVTVFFTVLIFVLIVYYGLKYRKRPGHAAVEVHAPMALEIVWSVIPLILCLIMFWWGTRLFLSASRPPAGAMEIYVIGKQWMWKIQHPEGRKEINELHVPIGVPVKLIMASQDVIHDFGLPAFRIKRDVVPGTYSEEWFTADQIGEYHLFCDQYCGAQHAEMIGKVVVMEQKDYQRWLSGAGGDKPMRTSGEQLFISSNCMSCHGTWAPTMAGLYMSNVKLADGRTVVADAAYIRTMILDPGAHIVDGYQANSTVLMPTFRGSLTEEQIGEIIEYIKSLASAASFGPAAQPVPSGGSNTEMRKPGFGGPPPNSRDPLQPVE
jgi:cytochrome c oxidase subunit 2